MEASKCPKCGEEPHFLEHVDKWYCYGCNEYIEDGVDHVCADEGKKDECAEAIKQEIKALDEEPELECKNCGAVIEELKDGKLYCYVCETYQDEAALKPGTKPGGANDAQKLLEVALARLPHGEPSPAPAPPPSPGPVEAKPEMAEPTKDEPEQPPAVAAAPAVEAGGVRMCPGCGQALKWIEKYQRHYCYSCKKYAPKEAVEPKPVATAPAPAVIETQKTCPGCGGELKFIEKYSEHYCFTCRKYPLKEAKKAEQPRAPEASPEAEKAPEPPACPKCKGSLRWIEKYSRHYCDKCKEYAPKGHGGARADPNEKKHCPACREAMKLIAEYNEWYCYKCKKYSLRPSKPVLLM